MWGLIHKDLFLLRKTVLWSLAIGTFISLAVLRTGAAGMIVISTSAITYTFMVTALYLEEKNNSLSFLKLLPLPAVRIVDAKFFGAWASNPFLYSV
ncbi:MAG: ABC-2 transporter permease [Moorellaceae bacterium]